MLRMALCVASALLISAPIALATETYVETFEGSVNSADWSYGNSGDTIDPAGGNPGAWLHSAFFFTFSPILTTDYYGANFTGNYREMGVSMISIDGITEHIDFGPNPIEMTVLLRDTNGTPNVIDDDDYAYCPGPAIPEPGAGWIHYDFAIPSDSTEPVPAGWFGGWVGDPENFRPGIDWNDVIQSVDRLEIWWWHPAYFGIIQGWEVGADNISITWEPMATPVESTTWGEIKNSFVR